ncbi:MAG: hypothetical protein AABY22_35830 [Nanoarchaeota archaeon]
MDCVSQNEKPIIQQTIIEYKKKTNLKDICDDLDIDYYGKED